MVLAALGPDVSIFLLPAPLAYAWIGCVLLARRPNGVPQPDDFTLDEAAVPVPGPNQFLVRNIYLSVDPAQRGWASAEANYSAPVALGTPMRGLTVEARRSSTVSCPSISKATRSTPTSVAQSSRRPTGESRVR